MLDLAEGACLAFGLAAIAWLLMLYARMLVSHAPQEMREGALLLTTLALLDGRNPYAPESIPSYGNLYGILYPLLVVPFAWLLGPGLAVHRLVASLGLVVAAWLVYRGARQAGAARGAALLGALLCFVGWIYWVGGTVRPDGVGLALMLGALVLAAPDPASPRRFALALALSLLGLATKIYFVGGVLIIAAYVTLFVSWRRGVAMGFAALCAIGAMLVLLRVLLPAWPALVLGANLGAASYDVSHLLRQGWDWLIFSLPLLAASIGLLCLPRAHWLGKAARRKAGFWAFSALCGLAVLLVSLGGHPGAHMTYFFHLLTPPLTIAVFAAAGDTAAPRRALVLALPLAVLLNAHWFPSDPARFAAAEARFGDAARLIATAEAPLVTTEFAALAALAGHIPVETGHSEYFRDAGQAAPPTLLAPLWLPRPLLAARAEAMLHDLAEGLTAQRFDVILANRRDIGLVRTEAIIAAGYVPVAAIDIDMVWAEQRWQGDVWRATRF